MKSRPGANPKEINRPSCVNVRSLVLRPPPRLVLRPPYVPPRVLLQGGRRHTQRRPAREGEDDGGRKRILHRRLVEAAVRIQAVARGIIAQGEVERLRVPEWIQRGGDWIQSRRERLGPGVMRRSGGGTGHGATFPLGVYNHLAWGEERFVVDIVRNETWERMMWIRRKTSKRN